MPSWFSKPKDISLPNESGTYDKRLPGAAGGQRKLDERKAGKQTRESLKQLQKITEQFRPKN